MQPRRLEPVGRPVEKAWRVRQCRSDIGNHEIWEITAELSYGPLCLRFLTSQRVHDGALNRFNQTADGCSVRPPGKPMCCFQRGSPTSKLAAAIPTEQREIQRVLGGNALYRQSGIDRSPPPHCRDRHSPTRSGSTPRRTHRPGQAPGRKIQFSRRQIVRKRIGRSQGVRWQQHRQNSVARHAQPAQPPLVSRRSTAR